jgi:sugar phosphate isomerase/epimerase
MLTYCTNIHPAESWTDTFANVQRYVPQVKREVSPAAPFPIGLRLSGRAAGEIDQEERERFQEWCAAAGCFVATVNGFPFGTFHNAPIKEAVYLPDWRHPERLHYTRQLADLLSFWLPAGKRGSISTVPLGFRDNIGPEGQRLAAHNIRQALEFLDRLAQKTGKEIILAIEPEPSCALETTLDVVQFFTQLNLPASLRPFLAVCYDCCHQALQFETPAHSLRLLADNNIRIGHVQVSSALRLEHPDIGRLERYSEPCYLHQTVGRRRDGSLVRFPDLDPALTAGRADVEEWRVHFHVPVFMERLTDCASTQPFLKEILSLFGPDIPLEVETYTWAVLPPDLQTATVTESIVREIEWVQRELEKAELPSAAQGG